MPVLIGVCIGIEYVTAVVLKYISGSVCTGILLPLQEINYSTVIQQQLLHDYNFSLTQ